MANPMPDASLPEQSYREAGRIANEALMLVLSNCVPGRRIVELCHMGDSFVEAQCAVHAQQAAPKGRKKKGKKKGSKQQSLPSSEDFGLGFPTCVSVGERVANQSPLLDDEQVLELESVVTVEVGVHIHGYLALAAHTVQLNPGYVARGRFADAMAAAYTVAECALRMLKPGVATTDFGKMTAAVGEDFECQHVAGVRWRKLDQWLFGVETVTKLIDARGDEDVKSAESAIDVHEAYTIDVQMTTSKKPGLSSRDDRPTVYRRDVTQQKQLKLRASRSLLAEVNRRYPVFPFSLRSISQEANARLGITECLNKGLLIPYPVESCEHGEFVARLQFTALVSPNGIIKIAGLPVDTRKIETGRRVMNQNVLQVLAQSLAFNQAGAQQLAQQNARPLVPPAFNAPPVPQGMPGPKALEAHRQAELQKAVAEATSWGLDRVLEHGGGFGSNIVAQLQQQQQQQQPQQLPPQPQQQQQQPAGFGVMGGVSMLYPQQMPPPQPQPQRFFQQQQQQQAPQGGPSGMDIDDD